VRIIALVCALLASQLAEAAPGVEHLKVSTPRGSSRQLTVLLPPGYKPGAKNKRYPVLYLMDGQNLLSSPFHAGGWRAKEGLDQAIHDGLAEPMIVVGVHQQDRMNELTFVADPKHGGGGGDKLLEQLVDEVVPFVEQRYSTRRGRGGRAIGGSSLGGQFAMNTLLRRGDVFGRGLVFSPSVWWSGKALLGEVAASSTLHKQRVVLYNGGYSDGRADAEELRDLLNRKGLRFGRSLFHWTEPGAAHDEPSWASFFPKGLGLLFPSR
jgi:predicted alpha/beta superfamily hydrolase